MSNMGYCRFYNTLQDLEDCNGHIFDDDLSDDEEQSRKRLIALCKQISLNFQNEDDEAEAMDYHDVRKLIDYHDVRKLIDYGDI